MTDEPVPSAWWAIAPLTLPLCVFLFYEGAGNEPYIYVNACDFFTQAVLPSAFAALWLQWLLMLVVRAIQRQVGWRVLLGAVPLALVALYVCGVCVFGYLSDVDGCIQRRFCDLPLGR